MTNFLKDGPPPRLTFASFGIKKRVFIRFIHRFFRNFLTFSKKVDAKVEKLHFEAFATSSKYRAL
jgi:hypothetical protein